MKPFVLTKNDYEKDNVLSYGNMFLIGNGHLGYRGTLEEYGRDEMVALNLVGLYDRYKKKWRESVNLPNPFKVVVKGHALSENKPTKHEIRLDIEHAVFERETVYEDLTISSRRIVHQGIDNLLMCEYVIKASKAVDVQIELGLDTDIHDINGPHFKSKHLWYKDGEIRFAGVTNENKGVAMAYKAYANETPVNYVDAPFATIKKSLGKDETLVLKILAKVIENEQSDGDLQRFSQIMPANFDETFKESEAVFEAKFHESRILVEGKAEDEAQFPLDYSVYHLLILGNENYLTSIPARGVSGQTYKGAIFWDTEIFLLPFFALTNPKVARNLIVYRIKGLKGAKKKARSLFHKGAFYAWESQEDGYEACSKHNVSDPITNKPIRTYFSEKQIHIDFDIVYAIDRYVRVTGDFDILKEGAFEVIEECIRFLLDRVSYDRKDGLYHLRDVIGPDEYHERVDDNAFTNYMAANAISVYLDYAAMLKAGNPKIVKKSRDLQGKLYLPKPNKDGVIEQFKGYFDLEDTSVEEVKKRVNSHKEYLGGRNGVASSTKVIKQADVVALLALLPELYGDEVVKANYDYYLKYTEHGSSLSSSMYSICASRLGYHEDAYKMMLKSAKIDLGKEQKMFAGGIYIGGTHPASNGGAYLSLVFGMCGLHVEGSRLAFSPINNPNFDKVTFSYKEGRRTYKAEIDHERVLIKEVKP